MIGMVNFFERTLEKKKKSVLSYIKVVSYGFAQRLHLSAWD